MIKEISLPKFLVFILEGNIIDDGCYIPGYKSSSILLPELIIRGFKYDLVGGICASTTIYFTSFIFNY